MTGDNYYAHTLKIGGKRNYSYLYDKTMYAALWVAYPLTSAHISGSAKSSWGYNPLIPSDYQVNVVNRSYPGSYGADDYARGHQIPNADRKSSGDMNAQTYYVTNQTPQLQDKFNGSIWSSLENSVRSLTSSTDTVYVVTGACFQTVGGNETINYLHSSTVTPENLPIPNYYWKVLLKVRRGTDGTITEASSIGVWLEHKEYTDSNWGAHVTSVADIETKTGFNFFPWLSEEIQATTENNSNWNRFSSF